MRNSSTFSSTTKLTPNNKSCTVSFSPWNISKAEVTVKPLVIELANPASTMAHDMPCNLKRNYVIHKHDGSSKARYVSLPQSLDSSSKIILTDTRDSTMDSIYDSSNKSEIDTKINNSVSIAIRHPELAKRLEAKIEVIHN